MNPNPNDSTLTLAYESFKKSELDGKNAFSMANDENDVVLMLAISKAYQDMSPRTIKGHEPEVKKVCCEKLLCSIKEFFDNPAPKNQGDFDDKHRSICNDFLEKLNKELRKKKTQEQQFGKAQKIVNMTFKYLYCLMDSSKAEWFKYAHMPLDTFTLAWYSSLQEDGKIDSWSGITEEDYRTITGEIREALKPEEAPKPKKEPQYCGMRLPESPLLADFIIWAEGKRKQQLSKLEAKLNDLNEDGFFKERLEAYEAEKIRLAMDKLTKKETP